MSSFSAKNQNLLICICLRFTEALDHLEEGLGLVNKLGDEKLASYRWPGSQVIIDDTKPGKLLVIIFSHFSVIFFVPIQGIFIPVLENLVWSFTYSIILLLLLLFFLFSFDAVNCSRIFAVCKFSILICPKNPLSIVQEFFLDQMDCESPNQRDIDSADMW